ncbi:MAG: hypothetical protein AAGD14_11440 [Planctomycetota bacterium]
MDEALDPSRREQIRVAVTAASGLFIFHSDWQALRTGDVESIRSLIRRMRHRYRFFQTGCLVLFAARLIHNFSFAVEDSTRFLLEGATMLGLTFFFWQRWERLRSELRAAAELLPAPMTRTAAPDPETS